MMPLTTNRTWAFFLATRARPHSPAGETSLRSASPPLVAIQSGTKPVRTGTANHTLDFLCLFFFPLSLLILPSRLQGIGLISWRMLY
jgi:hypothetical protein